MQRNCASRPPDPSLTAGASFVLELPPAPAHLNAAVKAWEQDVEILTYPPGRPDVNPMFLEKRVYQGSSGRVYPLPFIDRIAIEPERGSWKAIHLENEYLRVMILPEIGGRIHIGYDKTTGFDFFYRQNVIKPALVGLAGPWISGGVEFNWPQHHRPATFMPVSTDIESSTDGSVTVWCSDHDPMLRMKGMHGICLHPGQALLDVKVRLYNRTPFTQTFLWWANVATRVHEHYQSFFPTDVRFVADHAKRAVTSFSRSDGTYYGVDYGERARSGVPADEAPRQFVPDGSYPADDLSWYANIPVPTSYMITATEDDFFGGYDHRAHAGVVHVADHHIAPGKKQWTWGNHEFGYAWDRNLTNHDGPYIELMAGVYTDNQPDFSYLAPWETKVFTQCWYPISQIGVPQAANRTASLALRMTGSRLEIGSVVTQPLDNAVIELERFGTEVSRWTQSLSPSEPLLLVKEVPADARLEEFSVTISAQGRVVIAYDCSRVAAAKPPIVAKEPAAPSEIETVDELYLTGLHLEQYRHATRLPEVYWQEGLRRDPGENRLHNALGLWRMRRGEFAEAAEHFEAAIARLTQMNPNPRDGEAFYNLGMARRFLSQTKPAYDAFYKATWNAAWGGPAYLALAEGDAAEGNWQEALEHAQRSLRADADNLAARHLLAVAMTYLGRLAEAEAVYEETLAIDPLDAAARWHRGLAPPTGQECLDLAFDLLRAGQRGEALRILTSADLSALDGSVPMILFTRALVEHELGLPEAPESYRVASEASLAYCFPSRLEEIAVLEAAIERCDHLWAPHYLLGNLLYDKRRYESAIAAWEAAAAQHSSFATVHRNLGIAYYNVRGDAEKALASFDRAFAADSRDARVLYERDQLWKRTGEDPQRRLQELLRHIQLVELRDDLSVELAMLYNQVGQPERALELLLHRRFQPWEGGEGLVLAQYTRARLLLGRAALEAHENGAAAEQFRAALKPPQNLGEARHLLANCSDICLWLGLALARAGAIEEARAWWQRAVRQKGDFQQMSVRRISDMTFWSALAARQLGNADEARSILESIYAYSEQLERTEPKIDYFATSLPAMLLFNEDLGRRSRIDAMFLRSQALVGLGRRTEAAALIRELLCADSNHAGAADLLSLLERDSFFAKAG